MHSTRISRFLRSSGLLALLMTCSLAGAQSWPDKPIRMVVPFPAGGATDVVARLIAQEASSQLGQQIVVENKSGAGGTIGAGEAARAAPDGYTILLTTSSTHAISPHLFKSLPYDPASFTPIAHLADAASILLVTPSLPANSVQELIDLARQKPDELNYASSGNGTIPHLTCASFLARAGVSMTHVPYRGTGPGLNDLIAGNIQVLCDSLPTGLPHVRSGKARALAVTGPERSPLAPELPTVAESGLPGYSSVTWFGLYGPAGLPQDIAVKLNEVFTKSVHQPDVTKRLRDLGIEPAKAGSPRQFADMVSADSERWGRIITESNITIQ
ncbi:tripartite-type tricarboxylate transporter receptor subunit TctC [Paracandidimonas soli]|uniref:Tripartite-type tricarboxylate transporter receptor subunit TctC n=2 Tax=Paracandidimonas soli TaxID=1917182 RepID=A0A4V2VSJ9_9BURK|nr:tripartite-type tricarboxylate transporter receptor subunit TctC [Paracandidimonas soli]